MWQGCSERISRGIHLLLCKGCETLFGDTLLWIGIRLHGIQPLFSHLPLCCLGSLSRQGRILVSQIIAPGRQAVRQAVRQADRQARAGREPPGQ